MRKNLIVFIITLIVETVITCFAANKFSIRFIEIMFFAGLAFTVITFWFSSSGGVVTRFSESQASSQTGMILKQSELIF